MEFPQAEQYSWVAVSVVTYNTDPTELLALLQSMQTTAVDVSVTVVDNSPDDTLRPVAEEAGAFYIYPGVNLGFGAAHNLALRRSLPRARYQLVVNPDIVMSAAVLPALCEFMEAHPQVGQVMPAVHYLDGSEQRLTKRLPTPADLFLRRFVPGAKSLFHDVWQRYEMHDVDLSRACEVPCLSGCFMFLRSAVLEEVGLFDERYFMYMEDVDLCRRIGGVGETVFYPGVSVVHGYSKGSYRNSRLFAMHLRSAIRYFTKWGWLFDQDRRARNHRSGRPAVPTETDMPQTGELEMTPL
jgi:hypothetical protein